MYVNIPRLVATHPTLGVYKKTTSDTAINTTSTHLSGSGSIQIMALGVQNSYALSLTAGVSFNALVSVSGKEIRNKNDQVIGQ